MNPLRHLRNRKLLAGLIALAACGDKESELHGYAEGRFVILAPDAPGRIAKIAAQEGDITFEDTIKGGHSLDITDAGTTTFNGAIGDALVPADQLSYLKVEANQINMNAGHGGSSGRYDYLHEEAFDYAFLLSQLGVEK